MIHVNAKVTDLAENVLVCTQVCSAVLASIDPVVGAEICVVLKPHSKNFQGGRVYSGASSGLWTGRMNQMTRLYTGAENPYVHSWLPLVFLWSGFNYKQCAECINQCREISGYGR